MLYAITKMDIFKEPDNLTLVFIFNNRYSNIIFQDIILDSGTAGVSIARKPQVIIFQRLEPTSSINTSTAGNHKIKFGIGEIVLLGIIEITTLLGNIIFHVFPTNILFLFCF
jgi:hypothetical protein